MRSTVPVHVETLTGSSVVEVERGVPLRDLVAGAPRALVLLTGVGLGVAATAGVADLVGRAAGAAAVPVLEHLVARVLGW